MIEKKEDVAEEDEWGIGTLDEARVLELGYVLCEKGREGRASQG